MISLTESKCVILYLQKVSHNAENEAKGGENSIHINCIVYNILNGYFNFPSCSFTPVGTKNYGTPEDFVHAFVAVSGSSSSYSVTTGTYRAYQNPLFITITDGKSTSKKSKESQLIAILFLVTTALLLLTFPQYVRYAAAAIWDYKVDPDSYASFIMLYHTSNKLFVTNNCINFALYVLSGNRFRRDLVNMFRGKNAPDTSMHSNTNTANTGPNTYE